MVALAVASAEKIDWSQQGDYNETDTFFYGVKFHKTASETMRVALYKALGKNGAYCEHESLTRIRDYGWQGAVCFASTPRVVLITMFREPIARYLSAVHFALATHHLTAEAEVPCLERTAEWYFSHPKQHPNASHSSDRGRMQYFLDLHPYADIFHIKSRDDLDPFREMLETHFVVGVMDNVDDLFRRLTGILRLDHRAILAYGGRQVVRHIKDGHVSTPYCKAHDLQPDVVATFRSLAGLDTDIFRIATDISQAQSLLHVTQLPIHDRERHCHDRPPTNNRTLQPAVNTTVPTDHLLPPVNLI